MDRTEAVTLFNDMCLLAPGALVDARIQWELGGRGGEGGRCADVYTASGFRRQHESIADNVERRDDRGALRRDRDS